MKILPISVTQSEADELLMTWDIIKDKVKSKYLEMLRVIGQYRTLQSSVYDQWTGVTVKG